MPESTMSDVVPSKPHLFGLAKIDDADTLRQVLGGWWPGLDAVQPQRILAGADANGEGFCIHPSRGRDLQVLESLAFPVHVINAVILPASAIKPAAAAEPYRR